MNTAYNTRFAAVIFWTGRGDPRHATYRGLGDSIMYRYVLSIFHILIGNWVTNVRYVHVHLEGEYVYTQAYTSTKGV